jgi:hypothetical protein
MPQAGIMAPLHDRSGTMSAQQGQPNGREMLSSQVEGSNAVLAAGSAGPILELRDGSGRGHGDSGDYDDDNRRNGEDYGGNGGGGGGGGGGGYGNDRGNGGNGRPSSSQPMLPSPTSTSGGLGFQTISMAQSTTVVTSTNVSQDVAATVTSVANSR